MRNINGFFVNSLAEWLPVPERVNRVSERVETETVPAPLVK